MRGLIADPVGIVGAGEIDGTANRGPATSVGADLTPVGDSDIVDFLVCLARAVEPAFEKV